MKIHSSLNTLNATRPIVTIGMFDGVHLGHRHLIAELVAKAKSENGESVVVTFWPHPRIVLGRDTDSLRFITTQEEKTRMLSELGVNHLLLLPFTLELAALSADEFVDRILVQSIGVHHLLMGFNHRFGKGRSNQYEDYEKLALKHGFSISRSTPVTVGGLKCSSTSIRNALLQGDIELGNKLLGYLFQISGRVIGGNRLGRTIGYPTANVELGDNTKIIPVHGVYACHVHTEGRLYDGMLNIGVRPTVSGGSSKSSIEVHILDFNHDIYSEVIDIQLVKYIRSEQKFSSLEALKAQLNKDEETVRNLFSSI